MNDNHLQEPIDEGLEKARRMVEEEEMGLRHAVGWQRFIVPIVAFCWSMFQLSLSSWLLLDSTYVRSIHLAFALFLIYVSFPTLKRKVNIPGLRWMSATDRIPTVDLVIAVVAALIALYIAIDYEGIANRVGMPNTRDMIIGGLLVLILWEATRRVVGPALAVIGIVFTLYSFFGPYMPDFLSFKGVSLTRYIGQISLTTEGIYGVPIYVSAKIVFLYVLFGALLERAGAGKFFIDLAMSLLGRYKGGPAKAAVLSSGLTGLISGSSIANVVTTGTFTIPMMKKVGYPPKKAAAIEVAVSTNGQLMPPVMGAAAFIIAEYVNLPYLEVCKAAAIPAFASYVALFFLTHIEASKLGMRGLPKAELPVFFQVLFGGLHYLLPIFYLLYELIVPRHSPDMAAFRATMVLLVIMLFQHVARLRKEERLPFGEGLKLGVVDIFEGMVAGARNMVSVAVATAAAGVVVGVVTMGLGGLVTDIIDTLSMGNLYMMLGIVAIASLILGMGLPTTANYIVMASLTAPALVTLAGDSGFVVPLIAAHLFCFYFGILADDTPPVGLAAYAASAIARSEPIPTGIQGFLYDIRTAALPFMFIFNTDILLVGIDSFPLAIFIFVMTCFGTCSFAAATQGWFIAKNRFHETLLLFLVCAIMFRPDFWGHLIGLENHYICYLAGVALLVVIYLMQLPRARKHAAAIAATATGGAA
ncbi:TRAP transporter 4TM/12TM fusion protein [Geothermobacter ehrlichii]|uniref:TRAP transporter 4TM/12TM fusion protein n=1 Tax=Geothermobacter ehrlichii TaxID=213224 RepID=A0A5D3WH76_9BACT|nr:TRAP transporter permease [Geothermobacter ehrlichii]TYO98209.1 TRAP transporter 4TM/12TM fusion protein [Geothermobacter ehrlichii]